MHCDCHYDNKTRVSGVRRCAAANCNRLVGYITKRPIFRPGVGCTIGQSYTPTMRAGREKEIFLVAHMKAREAKNPTPDNDITDMWYQHNRTRKTPHSYIWDLESNRRGMRPLRCDQHGADDSQMTVPQHARRSLLAAAGSFVEQKASIRSRLSESNPGISYPTHSAHQEYDRASDAARKARELYASIDSADYPTP